MARRILANQSSGGGSGGGSAGGFIDDVFSTYVYEGNSGNQTIENGIDLDGEGGLTWFKARDDATFHILMDTERGGTKWLNSASAAAEGDASGGWITYNSDGFTLPQGINGLNATQKMASWTFRKAPSFFDVVTYTGNGVTGREIPHNLGVEPGMVIVKCLAAAHNWQVYHRGVGATHFAVLNDAGVFIAASAIWNNTEPTATHFTVGDNERVNQPADTYVAYVFAHDESDESMIKCGSYTGNETLDGPEIDLGFEPQWLLFKSATTSDAWTIFDAVRGITVGGNDEYLMPDNSGAGISQICLDPTSTGFKVTNTNAFLNESGADYIYMAIRRPNKPAEEFEPEELFAMSNRGPDNPNYVSGFPVDMFISTNLTGGKNQTSTRPVGKTGLYTDEGGSEYAASSFTDDWMDGYGSYSGYNNDFQAWMWRRAPGFFDVVTWTGDSQTVREVPHNLGAEPRMMWVKVRDSGSPWGVYDFFNGPSHYLDLSRRNESVYNTLYWKDIAPTDTVFTVGYSWATNKEGYNFLAYLFASAPGICDIDSFTGTGADLDIDCGFTNGARFVLIKRTDLSGDWMYFDTLRGISASDSPMLKLNETDAQVTGSYIKPHPNGFTVTSNLTGISGGEFIYMAIA